MKVNKLLSLGLIAVASFGCSTVNQATKRLEKVIKTPILVFPKKYYPPHNHCVDAKQHALNGIKHFEGFYSKPYRCPGNKITIGYGFTGKYYSKRITKQKADSLLEGRVWKDHEDIVKKNVKVPLNDYQLCSLVSFTFNTGEGSLKKLVNGPGRLNSGNYNSVPTLMLRYCKAKGKILKGLQKRRVWEAALFKGKIQSYGN